MSLNGGFNEPGGFQSGGNQSAAESGDKGAFGGGAENRARASAVRSAAINAGAGQKVNAGFFGGKYRDNVTQAEIAAAKAARNNPNNMFGAGAYDRTRGFGSTGLGGLMRGFNPLSMIAGLIGGPFAGLAMKGLTGIKNKFNDVTNNPDDLSLRERLTGYKTQADYEKARADRQVASRRDKMQDRIDQGYNSMFGMKTGPITDQQRATLANLNTQTGISNNVIGGDPTSTRFSDFAPRVGLETQPNTKSFYENEMSIPTQPQGLSTSFNIGDSFLNNNPEVRGMLGINNNLGSTEPASTFGNANFINSDIAPEFRDMVTKVGTSYGKDTTVIDAQERIDAGVAMAGDLDIVNAATNKTTSVPNLSNPDVLNKIATSTGMPMEGVFTKTPTDQTTRDIKSIQNYKRNPELQMSVPNIMELDIGQRLGQPQIQSIYDMVQAEEETPIFARNGGLASMFTGRR